jgi:hypothetical protein
VTIEGSVGRYRGDGEWYSAVQQPDGSVVIHGEMVYEDLDRWLKYVNRAVRNEPV